MLIWGPKFGVGEIIWMLDIPVSLETYVKSENFGWAADHLGSLKSFSDYLRV